MSYRVRGSLPRDLPGSNLQETDRGSDTLRAKYPVERIRRSAGHAVQPKSTQTFPLQPHTLCTPSKHPTDIAYLHQLYILEVKFSGNRHDSTRALAILHALDRAVTASPSPLPDTEFSFCVSDTCDPTHTHTIWALSRLAEDEKMWLMPDFGYWAWPLDLVGGYEQIRAEIVANENESKSGQGWNKKIPKVVWRGAIKTNKLRETLVGVTRGKIWADVQGMQWKNRTHVSEWSVANAIPMVDHCAYQFVLQTEGLFSAHVPCYSYENIARTDVLHTRRTQLLWPRKVPPQLRLSVRHAQS